jgi:peptidoglycan hydrolase-like protein with peptidoglycan-binding domain
MTGSDVKQLQQYLNSNGYPVASTGFGATGNETSYFGGLTSAAVTKLQKDKQISVNYGTLDLPTRVYLGCVESKQAATAATETTTVGMFTRNLELGMTGDDVKMLQKYLNSHGYPLATSGAGSNGFETNYFGNLTKQALISFQKGNGILPAEGYFGVATRGVMGR